MGAKTGLKRVMIYVAGWGFIVLGILGLVLPILQGILFLLIGLFLLSSVSPRAERLLRKIRKRFPRLSSKLDEAAPKAREAQRRIAARADRLKLKTKRLHARIFERNKRRPGDRPAG